MYRHCRRGRGSRTAARPGGRRSVDRRHPYTRRRPPRLPQLVPPSRNGTGRGRLRHRRHDPLPVPPMGIRPRWTARVDAAVRRRAARPVRPFRLRSAGGAERHMGTAALRLPVAVDPTARRVDRRPPGTDGRLPARPVGRSRHLRARDRGQLEADQRELPGVLPPDLDPPGARSCLPSGRSLPVPGAGDVLRPDDDPGVGRRARRLAGVAAGRRSRRIGPRERALRGDLPERPAVGAAEPRVGDAARSDRARPHSRDLHDAAAARERGRARGGHRADPRLLAVGQRRGRRHRRAESARPLRRTRPGRSARTAIRGAAPPLPQHARRPHDLRSRRCRIEWASSSGRRSARRRLRPLGDRAEPGTADRRPRRSRRRLRRPGVPSSSATLAP